MYKALEAPDANRFENAPLNPNLQYLEAHSPTSQALLVLGYVAAPAGQPAVQTWYDAEQQLLRLQNGFLINITGAPNSISNTEYTWPAANPGTNTGEQPWLPVSKTYSQPEMNVFNKTVPLQYEAIAVTEVPRRNSVLRQRALRQQGLNWYREIPANKKLPYSLHAFTANGTPVYGSQCLAASECIEWLYKTNTAP